jgi:hypothetical protein
MLSSEHFRWAIFQIYNIQNLEITRITTFHICNIVYQAGSQQDPMWFFNFLHFFERTLSKFNYIIFILSWCGTHTKNRSTSVVMVTTGSQKITVWGPGGTPLSILRVNTYCFSIETMLCESILFLYYVYNACLLIVSCACSLVSLLLELRSCIGYYWFLNMPKILSEWVLAFQDPHNSFF